MSPGLEDELSLLLLELWLLEELERSDELELVELLLVLDRLETSMLCELLVVNVELGELDEVDSELLVEDELDWSPSELDELKLELVEVELTELSDERSLWLELLVELTLLTDDRLDSLVLLTEEAELPELADEPEELVLERDELKLDGLELVLD